METVSVLLEFSNTLKLEHTGCCHPHFLTHFCRILCYRHPIIESKSVGSEAEFTRVVLPPPTQACVDARAPFQGLCGDDLDAKVGSPEGACDTDPQPLRKWIASSFYHRTHDLDTSEALWSPAHAIAANMQVSTLQYGQMFEYWLERGTDKDRFDRRDAVCRWVSENLDLVRSWIPESYPRVIHDNDLSEDPVSVAALGMSILAIFLVMVSFLVVFLKRNTQAMYYTQVGFLFFILVGLSLVCAGALLQTLPPSNASCAVMPWLTNIGYVFHLVPLFLRINETNKLQSSGNPMKRLRLRMNQLVRAVVVGLFFVGAFLTSWAVIDSPEKAVRYATIQRITTEGETVVLASESCGTEYQFWIFVSIAWQALLVFSGIIVAIVAGRMNEGLNDLKALSTILCLHLTLLSIQTVTLMVADEDDGKVLFYTSLILSIDAILAIMVYIVPKFLNSGEKIDSEILPELFLHTTILLVNIDGFTAWSSVREPNQVFKFLEQLYETFDSIADTHKIYKVETTGEYYGKFGE